MKVIIGLGNPGQEYEKTRHNVGFMFLDYIKEKHNFSDFKKDTKFNALISTGFINGEKTILMKPLTYMNLSGTSVQKIMNFYKLNNEQILIISDDASMDFGKVRFRNEGSAGGHNGLKSVIEHIGENFKRIKVGIGYEVKYALPARVLGKFSDEEVMNLFESFEQAETLLVEPI